MADDNATEWLTEDGEVMLTEAGEPFLTEGWAAAVVRTFVGLFRPLTKTFVRTLND
ncbi:MAG: hypothetical protein AAFP81_16860 [Pseudomonadota bacterium]